MASTTFGRVFANSARFLVAIISAIFKPHWHIKTAILGVSSLTLTVVSLVSTIAYLTFLTF
jgi:hypothetical protein